MVSFPRIVLFVSVLAVQVGLGLFVTARSVAPARFESRRRRAQLVAMCALATAATLAIELGARRWAPYGGGLWRPLVAVTRVAGFALMVSSVGIVAVQVAASLGAALDGLRARIRSEVAPLPGDAPTRRDVLAQALSAGVAGITSSACLWGSLRERHDLQLTELTVTVPDLPPDLEGLTIVQLTDLHVGIFTGPDELARVVERANALRGDLVVLTGDLVDNNPRHIPDGMRALARLRARFGVHAILGNHDHYTGGDRVRRGLRDAGLSCLVNESVSLHGGDPSRGTITLAGVDDVMAPRLSSSAGPDLARALRGKDRDAPTVLLAHNPVYIEESEGRVALQLSGHTHGGQINVGNVAGRVLPFVAGRYVRGGTTLFVSRGVGITGPPVRLAAAPEVVRIALTARRT